MIQYSLLALITFLAYLVKGLTGFGPAIVFVSMGSLVLPPAQVVAMSPFLDIVAGLFLVFKDRSHTSAGYWLVLSVPLLFGVVIGAMGLRFASSIYYHQILGSAIVALGIWFLVRDRLVNNGGLNGGDRLVNSMKDSLPDKPERGAILAAISSGISGGLFGISGPPLIWYFGTRYKRPAFRQIIVPLFLMEASGRAAIYIGLGMIQPSRLILVGSIFPMLFLGLFIGNKWFNIISQEKFERIIGAVLICSGAKLFFS